MIFDFLITGLFSLLTTVFGALPTLPAVSDDILAPVESLANFIHDGAKVLGMIFSPALFTAALVVIFAVIFFEQIYHTVMWIVRKIPIINIK